MAKLTYKKRKALKPKSFVFPKDQRYPIEDISHARNALARSSGTADEAAVKTAVYAKYPSLKQDETYSDTSKVTLRLAYNQQVELDNKMYPVLAVGKIFSAKYGELEITPEFTDKLIKNFQLNILETVPFVDQGHDRDKSCGIIKNIVLQDGMVMLDIEWNTLGRDLISDHQYMYLSVDIGPHTDSATGEIIYPVLNGAALCNNPVFKDQKTLELSEKSAGTPGDPDLSELQFNGGISMDKIKKMIDSLVVAIQEAVKGDETGSMKKVMHALIEHMEEQTGLEDGDENDDPNPLENPDEAPKEEPTMPAADDQLKDGMEAMAPGAATDNKPIPAEAMPEKKKKVQMSETEIQMSGELKLANDKIKELEGIQAEQKKALILADFEKRYVNKKIMPAQKEDYFALFLMDQVKVSKLLDAMKDLCLTTELGTGDDITTHVISDQIQAKKMFDEKALKLAEIEKIDAALAADKLRKAEPNLYNLAYPAYGKNK